MSRIFQITFIILCIAALFITGIPLAKYLSKQYLQLRRELNSQDVLKYSSHQNLSPDAAKFESHVGNQNSIFIHEDIKGTLQDVHSNFPVKKSSPLQAPAVKVKKRSKRRAPNQQDKEFISWSFNLNITRYPNNTIQETNQDSSNILPKNKHLDVALYAEGKAQEQAALGELQNALKHVKRFIGGFFANTKNETYQELEFTHSPLMRDKNGSSSTKSEDINILDFGKGRNETLGQKGREPKFILEWIGNRFGGKRPETTTQLPEENITVLPTEDENSNAFRKQELVKNLSTLPAEFVTEKLQKGINSHSESPVLITTSPTVFEEGDSLSQFNFQGTTTQNECSDCVPESFESPDSENETEEKANVISKTSDSTPVFTDEVLEKFCMSLVNKIAESQQLSDEEDSDFDPELDENNRLRSQNPSILGLLTLFNSLNENKSTTNSAVIEDSFLVSDASPVQTTISGQKRFLNFNMFAEGSGRSAIVDNESNNLISGKQTENIDIGNLPSILDCENYFRKKQSTKVMFPKPNLMDMMSDPKIQLVDFSNATISSKLKEQQLQFLTDLLKSGLNNSVEDTLEKPQSNVENISESIEIVNQMESHDDNLTDTSTNVDKEDLHSTQVSRDARFFSELNVGSGSDERPKSSDSDLFSSFIGSGEGVLETDNAPKLDRSGEFGSGEAFHDNTLLFSDNTRMRPVSEDLQEEFMSTTSVQESRFLGMFGFGGSGDGRDFNENKELASSELTPFTGDECIDECSDEISNSSVQSYDCNDCNFENFHNTGNAEFTEEMPRTESECDDCPPYITDNISNDTFIDIFNEEPTNFSRNLTEDFHSSHGNCTCFQKHSGGDTSFSECDECNSNVLELPDLSDPYQPEEISDNSNRTKSTQSNENDCHDCDYESHTHGTMKINDGSEMSFLECDECNSSVIDAHDESHEIAENSKNDSLSENILSDKTISFSECDECNHQSTNGIAEDLSSMSGQDMEDNFHIANRTKSNQGNESDCYDCDYENIITSNTDSEMSFLECDECNSSIIDAHAESHEITKNSQILKGMSDLNGTKSSQNELLGEKNTFSDRDESFSECDECDHQSTNGILEDLNKISTQDHESDLHTANETTSHKEISLKGDESNSDIIDVRKESFETTENHPFNAISDGATLTNAATIETKSINNTVTLSRTDSGENVNAVIEPLNTTETPRNDLTSEIAPRIIRPIFLSGSGDGNLFGDNGGPINLVEEESTIISPVVIPRRRARVELDNEEPCEDCSVDFSEMNRNNPVEVEQILPVQKDTERSPKLFETVNVGDKEATVSSEIFPIQSSTDIAKTKLQPRHCSSARECNSTLNEHCITINSSSSSVCGCNRAFVRHKETNICVVKRVAEVSLKLPAEKFDADLENPLSSRYKQMKKDVNEMMRKTLRHNPELWKIVAEMELAGFSKGSLVVNWNLIFAVETESEASLIKDVESELQNALKDRDFIQKASLNISNASVLAFVSEINPCKSSELNYCSENAYCVWNDAVPGRFACYCKEHYRDDSLNQRYRGETCTAKCPPEYCGSNGHCEILANDERNCLCNGLYFGRRCEVPGMFVLGILAVIASISIIVAFVVAFKKRCATVSYGGSQAIGDPENIGSRTNDRVSDAIALEENIGSKVLKFANISTPVQNLPAIKVTRATNESSISFECDSTFDVTPRNAKGSEQYTSPS